MICGALQTLNEEAFEDVVASERPSPTGGPSGELIAHDNAQSQAMSLQSQQSKSQQMQQQQQQSQQPLTPIQETIEQERSLFHGTDRRQSHTINYSTNNKNNSNISTSVNFSINKLNNNTSPVGSHEHHSNATSASQSLSSSINHLSGNSLLTLSNTNDNEKPSSTVILMPNICDGKPFMDDTRL